MCPPRADNDERRLVAQEPIASALCPRRSVTTSQFCELHAKAPINRIDRGRFSFAFVLQFLAAMGVESLPVPKPPSACRVSHVR